jgi:hypothetical protein
MSLSSRPKKNGARISSPVISLLKPIWHPTPKEPQYMKSLQELTELGNRAKVDLLLADAEMALTMLDLARTSEAVELRQRRTGEALKTYTFIRKRIPTISLTHSETAALNQKMSLLKQRLALS